MRIVPDRFLVVLVLLLLPAACFGESIDKIADRTISIQKEVQKLRDNWFRERSTIQSRIEALQQEKKALMEELEGLRGDIDEERKKLKDLKSSISRVRAMREKLSLHLFTALLRLESDIKKGIPFYVSDRLEKVEEVKKVLRDPSLSLSAKYRSFLSLLQRELSYSYSVEPYYGSLNLGGVNYYGEFLRIGRVALYFRTTSGDLFAWYDPTTSSWKEVGSSSLKRDISLAFDIARRRRAAELLRLPLGKLGGWR